MRRRVVAAVALALTVSACNATGAPTYTSAGVTISGCPQAPTPPGHPVQLSFSVLNRSHLTWPATYLLLSPSGAMRAKMKVLGAQTESIGGGITRVRTSLRPGHRVSGSIRAYLAKPAAATVNLGAWGAPSNSLAVPTSYTNPGCTLQP